jgi:hypothetical protein
VLLYYWEVVLATTMATLEEDRTRERVHGEPDGSGQERAEEVMGSESKTELGTGRDEMGERDGWYDLTGKRGSLGTRWTQQGEARQTEKAEGKIC